MEDFSQLGQGGANGAMRRNFTTNIYDRPSSSSSTHTRKAPSSSGHSATSSTPRASKGTSLLQERLRERKIEGAKSGSASADRSIQSSPVRGNMRDERKSSLGGVGKGMGVKQIEEVGLIYHF